MPSESQGGESRVMPITPEQARAGEHIPNEVISVFNSLIEENAVNGTATVNQEHVVRRLEEMGMNRQEIFSKGWLNVEEMYRGVGWNVKYEKPGYNEDGVSLFTFTTEKKG